MFDTLEIEVVDETSSTDTQTESEFSGAREAYQKAVEDFALEIHTNPNINLDDATTRFSTALNIRYLKQKTVCIIGVGGIGNWVVQILRSMGVTKLVVIDDDTVELHNVCPQNFNLVDIGLDKVKAVAASLMQHSGVAIRTHKTRVSGYNDILELCGNEAPDILITAVDNMEFRNQCAEELLAKIMAETNHTNTRVPELFIDLRMSLGDWTAYAIPCKAIIKFLSYDDKIQALYNIYKAKACFEQDDAVQEPCTARAIGYTGANIASFVGAYLHWYTNEGRLELMGITQTEEASDAKAVIWDYFGELVYNKCKFKMHTTFSSRDWEFITPTAQSLGFQYKLRKLNADFDEVYSDYEYLKGYSARLERDLEKLKAELANPVVQIAAPLDAGAAESFVRELLDEYSPEPEPAPVAAAFVEEEPIEVDLGRIQVGTEFRLVNEPVTYLVTGVNNTNVEVLNLETQAHERVSFRVLTTLCSVISYPGVPF